MKSKENKEEVFLFLFVFVFTESFTKRKQLEKGGEGKMRGKKRTVQDSASKHTPGHPANLAPRQSPAQL